MADVRKFLESQPDYMKFYESQPMINFFALDFLSMVTFSICTAYLDKTRLIGMFMCGFGWLCTIYYFKVVCCDGEKKRDDGQKALGVAFLDVVSRDEQASKKLHDRIDELMKPSLLKPCQCCPYSSSHNKDRLRERFQKMAQIAVVCDVMGKLFTYVVVKKFDAKAEERMPDVLIILEFLSTLAEAKLKWEHAGHAKL